jgi:hypothetical protein
MREDVLREDVLARPKLSGGCWLPPDSSRDVPPYSAAECFIARMCIRDLYVGIVRDGHEPHEAEEQRPCCVPIDPVHVITSPKDVESRKAYQGSGLLEMAETSQARASDGSPCAKIAIITPPPCAQAPVKALVPGLLPPYWQQFYSLRAHLPQDAALTWSIFRSD